MQTCAQSVCGIALRSAKPYLKSLRMIHPNGAICNAAYMVCVLRLLRKRVNIGGEQVSQSLSPSRAVGLTTVVLCSGVLASCRSCSGQNTGGPEGVESGK